MKAIRIIFLAFVMLACTKESNEYMSTGTIIGYDGTMCGCCGGWGIIIDDIGYRIDSMPENSGLNLTNEILPVAVKLDWQLVSNGCSAYNRISVKRIRKI